MAHNGHLYDFKMLLYEMHRHGVSLEVLRSRGVHLCDSLPAARLLNAKGISNTLSALYKQATGDEMEGAHDALADCRYH